MTNKKAISIIKNAFSWYEDNARESEEEDWSGQHEALRMAIKALEQQPCEDCISREQAKKFLYEEIELLHDDGLYDCFSRIIDDMYNELPPVKPKYTDEEIDKAQAVEQAYVDKMVELAVEETKRPKGKWISKYISGATDYELLIKEWQIAKCNKCGKEHKTPYIDCKFVDYKYCPNCGAEMSGGGEE